MEGRKNADGTYTFKTGHFSIYAVMTAEEADKVIAEQEKAKIERIKAGVKATTIKASSSAKKGPSQSSGRRVTDTGWTISRHSAPRRKTVDTERRPSTPQRREPRRVTRTPRN